MRATGDDDFMLREGVDILVETARMWADLGFWRENAASTDGRTFHIHGVTGPDEYTTVVNDNLFTNVMARFNLAKAAEVVRQLAATSDGARTAGWCERLELEHRRGRRVGGMRPRRWPSRSTRPPGSTRRTRTSWTARCGT